MGTILAPSGKMLVTRRKLRLAMPASIRALSNALRSVGPSPAPETTETAFGRFHIIRPPKRAACVPATRRYYFMLRGGAPSGELISAWLWAGAGTGLHGPGCGDR